MRRASLLFFAALSTGCGLFRSSTSPASSTAASTRQTTDQQEPGGGSHISGGDTDEVTALLAQTLTPRLCPTVLGTFVGLPGEGTAEGPAAGALASAGRWWIRQCTATVVEGRVQLSLAGNGWLWVDRETQGFRVRQYLLFDASASFEAALSVGYDRASHIASLWMTPRQGVTANITPRGTVSASPTGFFSRLLGGVASVTGTSVDDRARQQAGELGSRQLRERLGVGFTMTVALDTQQIDFMVGALHRGEVPQRPFTEATSTPWLVNQRSKIWPGGLDVVGPFETSSTAGASRLGLDIALEEGDGAVVSVVCADALSRYLDARFRSPDSAVSAPTGRTVITLAPNQGVQHVDLQNGGTDNENGCRLAMLIAPRSADGVAVQLRYRVMNSRVNTQTTAVSRRVRINVVGASVRATNAQGRAWDVIGGEADLTVVTSSIPLRREIDRSPVVADRNEARWNRWLPGAWEPGRDLPLRFSVFDDDTTGLEAIGSADLEAGALPDGGGEIVLPLRSAGAVPIQTGTLRLRVEPSQ